MSALHGQALPRNTLSEGAHGVVVASATLRQLLEFIIKSRPALATCTSQAVIFLDSQEHPVCWPLGSPPSEPLIAAARLAARLAKPVQTTGKGGDTALAMPLLDAGAVVGAVALAVLPEGGNNDELMLTLDVSCVWLSRMLTHSEHSTRIEEAQILPLLLAVQSGRTTAERLQRLADHLACDFTCRRVAVAHMGGRGRVRIIAVSGDKHFAKRSPLIHELKHDVAQARMEWNAASGSRPATRSDCDSNETLVVPVPDASAPEFALVLKREAAHVLSAEEQLRLKALARLVAPELDISQRAARDPLTLIEHLAKRVTTAVGAGPASSVSTLLAGIALLAFALLPANYPIKSVATVEGEKQRILVAPMDTYIDAVHVVAGDEVAAGTPLIEFTADDLILGQVKWASERARAMSARRDAAARQDRAKLRVLEAQIEHANAELELVRGQIARRALTAPIDGIIVSGDLTQRLGAPVKRGEALFEIVPRDAFRVQLLIDEHDINELAPGMRGVLKLAAFPSDRFTFSVDRVTPASQVTADGNHFVAYASIRSGAFSLRPGMAGVAHIDGDEHPRIANWTRALRVWIALEWWRWFG